MRLCLFAFKSSVNTICQVFDVGVSETNGTVVVVRHGEAILAFSVNGLKQ